MDSFELFQSSKQRLVFLTEDTKTQRLRILLAANGLTEKDYFIQPLHGVNNLSATVPVADFFTKQGGNTWVIVHRDGDCMTDDEKTWWIEREAKKLPERTYVWVTPLTDIEHTFCQPEHVAKVYGMSLGDAELLVENTINSNAAKLTVEFTQKRTNVKDSVLRKMEKVLSAHDLIGDRIRFDQVKGKSLFPLLLDALSAANQNPMRLTEVSSTALQLECLKGLIDKHASQSSAV